MFAVRGECPEGLSWYLRSLIELLGDSSDSLTLM